MPNAANGLRADKLREHARAVQSMHARLRVAISLIERTFLEHALPKHRRAFRRSVKKAPTRMQTMSAVAR
jgi:hypothetical protein